MNKDLQYPSYEAINSVLIKIGIDPTTRYDEHDQDAEYTTCMVEELDKYIALYKQPDTSIYEKRVLGCYFFECLNEYVEINNIEHELQIIAFQLLFQDLDIHKSEIEYWSETDDPDEDNWWPIRQSILEWKRKA